MDDIVGGRRFVNFFCKLPNANQKDQYVHNSLYMLHVAYVHFFAVCVVFGRYDVHFTAYHANPRLAREEGGAESASPPVFRQYF